MFYSYIKYIRLKKSIVIPYTSFVPGSKTLKQKSCAVQCNRVIFQSFGLRMQVQP